MSSLISSSDNFFSMSLSYHNIAFLNWVEYIKAVGVSSNPNILGDNEIHNLREVYVKHYKKLSETDSALI